MKTTRLLITMAALGAFTFAPGFAGEPSNPVPETAPSGNLVARRHADEKPGQSHASANGSQTKGTKTTAKPHSGPKLPQPFQVNGGHPGQKPTNNARSKSMSGNVAELHQPGLNKSAGVGKAGSVINGTENQRRLPVAGLSGTPLASQVVHPWAPSQAFIGGPAMWSAKNTAVIGGTGMKHKP